MNKLAREIVHSVVATDEVTSKYIGTDEENKLIHAFIASLKEQKVKATELLKDDWSSVYWDNIYARPDVQTEHYQQSFTYDQGKKQFKYDAAKDQQFRSAIKDKTHRDDSISSSLRLAAGFETSISASLPLDIASGSVSGKTNFDASFNISNRNVNDKLHTNDTQTGQTNSISEDRMKEHLLQNNQNTKWTGEKFEPKSLDLYRINTRDLKAKDEIAFQRVELTLTETIQTIELRPEQTPKDDSEFREWKLKLHDQGMKNIQQENELGNMREQIQNNHQKMLEKLDNIYENNVQQKNELGNVREQIQNNQQMLEKLEKNISGINVQQKNELRNVREQIQNNQKLLENFQKNKINECHQQKGKYFYLTNSCYYFSEEQVNWTTAQQRCISKNSNLTSIHSQEENDFIYTNSKLVRFTYWWAGLYFDKTGNKWKWIDDGVETKFTNWYSGQPNYYRNHEVGVLLSSYDVNQQWKWIDNPQSITWSYICKKKL
uniref:C-type lectin domain-containing protein n=1 Tax=Acrobeloides nanus TaxID=290746 RepID=A0A914E3N2_9BILA